MALAIANSAQVSLQMIYILFVIDWEEEVRRAASLVFSHDDGQVAAQSNDLEGDMVLNIASHADKESA